MNSIHGHIAERVAALKGGAIIFPGDFRGLGPDGAIKMSLCRIHKDGTIVRLGQGVYYKPHRSKKREMPPMEEIAAAIAKKESVRIKPSGQAAMSKLGLADSPPDEMVFITDGEPRNLLIGKNRLIFKSTTPKKLRISDGVSGLLIQALEEIGGPVLPPETKEKVAKILITVDEQQFQQDIRLAPAWIYNLLFKLKQTAI